jgi:trehalose synthase
MLSPIEVGKKSLDNCISISGERKIQEIKDLAQKLSGMRVLHINPSAFGGGVAEILFTLVPLMRDVGLHVDWFAIQGNERFVKIADDIYKALQSERVEITQEMQNKYMEICKEHVSAIEDKYDYIIVHTSDPVGMINFREKFSARWIWRCDLDISSPDQESWKFLCPIIQKYDGGIFTMKQFMRPDINFKNFAISPPSIDPLNLKNSILSQEEYRKIVQKFGVNPDKPIILQLSSFHPLKDPIGVIDSYRIVKEQIPDVQLVLITFIGSSNPDSWKYYEKTIRHAGEDYNIHFLSNMNGVGSIESNAFQRAASIIVKKSLNENFGVVVAEGLWKEKPVVASNVDGLSIQVVDEINGFLVNTTEEFAEKMILLLNQPELAKKMGIRGKEYVRENFLITRQLKDYLTLLARLSGVAD